MSEMQPSNLSGDSRIRIAHAFGALALLAALAALALFGVAGVGRGGLQHSNFDMRYMYAAGDCWLSGQSPYNAEAYQAALKKDGQFFAYPPSVAPLCLLLAAFPFGAAQVLMISLNLLCLLTIAFILRQAALSHDSDRPTERIMLSYVVPAVVIGNPFSLHVMWMGQTSIIALALTLLAWRLAQGTRPGWAALPLGIATFKPQFSLVLIVWFALQRRLVLLLLAGGVCLVAAGFPLWRDGLALAERFLDAGMSYRHQHQNVPGFRHVFGLQSALINAGVPAPTLAPLALAAWVGLFFLRTRYRALELPALLLAASCLLLYAHDYDLIMLLPLMVCAWGRVRDKPLLTAFFVILLIGLFFPQRWVREALEWSWAIRYRELAAVLLTLIVAVPGSPRPRNAARTDGVPA